MLVFNENLNIKLIVVHHSYCCSVVTVNNKNIVQALTFGSSNRDVGEQRAVMAATATAGTAAAAVAGAAKAALTTVAAAVLTAAGPALEQQLR